MDLSAPPSPSHLSSVSFPIHVEYSSFFFVLRSRQQCIDSFEWYCRLGYSHSYRIANKFFKIDRRLRVRFFGFCALVNKCGKRKETSSVRNRNRMFNWKFNWKSDGFFLLLRWIHFETVIYDFFCVNFHFDRNRPYQFSNQYFLRSCEIISSIISALMRGIQFWIYFWFFSRKTLNLR